MRFENAEEVKNFLAAVDKCTGNVWLTSRYGDKYNLKSQLSTYIAVAALLGNHGEELELWCDNKDDEQHFFKFFRENPNVNGR